MFQRARARRPSAAMIVAVIAMVTALTGSAVADNAVEFAKTKVLNGKNIKKKSIAGNKLRNNTVTGTQVNESKLGKVPSASKADTATSATSATNATNATNAGNAGALDGKDSAAFQSRWVLVGGDASVLAQSGGITTTKGTGNGRYYIHFPFSLASQPLSVSAAYAAGNDNAARAAKVVVCGGVGAAPGSVPCVGGAGNNNVNTAYVEILDTANATVDTPFYLVVSAIG
jgi:hypothetical protein